MTTLAPLPLVALLRNTALEVSLLAQGATTESVAQLRQRGLALVKEFESALEERHASADVRHDALYAQCGLLDETVLVHLPEEVRAQWEAQPLQVERFGEHDAGEHVFDRLSERMREVPPNVELLECYATVLGLGFKGRYARDGDLQRAAVVKSLSDLLARYTTKDDDGLIVDAARTRGLDWLYRLSPWAVAGLACAAAVIVFVVVGQALDLQLSHLLSAKS
ncbi:DotU family type IV/VI secretion system protein [Paraburkholderia sediminicola]|uniref:DotU family type IV/VI secretion system protein n=1 Tax=Paraburkholderia sediminicola TaxID=458836 RepID=UPI0038B84458